MNRVHLHGPTATASSVEKPLFKFPGKVTTTVTGFVTVLKTWGGAFKELVVPIGLIDHSIDIFGKTLRIGLVSANSKSESGQEIPPICSYAHWAGMHGYERYYNFSFEIPDDFGEIGAVTIENEHITEMFVKEIEFEGLSSGDVMRVTCNSWIHSQFCNPEKRVFFTNKSYLPSQTLDGLIKYRNEELEQLRGTGDGIRKESDRIYDYDVYNDLGDPDADADSARPVLGGNAHPYPRRCRTGCRGTKKGDKFAWFRDSEFARQALAGVNPCCIKLVTEWPLTSNLDPEVYGPAESAITTEIVEKEIGGYMTVNEVFFKR